MDWLNENITSTIRSCKEVIDQLQPMDLEILQDIVRLYYTKGWRKDSKDEGAFVLAKKTFQDLRIKELGMVQLVY